MKSKVMRSEAPSFSSVEMRLCPLQASDESVCFHVALRVFFNQSWTFLPEEYPALTFHVHKTNDKN